MNAFRLQFLCAANVVNVIRIPAVDENVVCIEQGQKIFYGFVNYRCREPSARPRAANQVSLQNLASELADTAFSLTSWSTASRDRSNTTQS